MSTTPVPHRLSTTIFTVVIPALSLGAAWLWVTTFSSQLPDPVAEHWGLDGQPDGFNTWRASFWTIAPIVALTCGIAAVIGLAAGRVAATRKVAAFLGVWAGIALPWFSAGTLYVQRGLSDAAQAPDITGPLLISFGVAALLGAGAAAVAPGDSPHPTSDAVPSDAARLPLADSETASWQHKVQMSGFEWIAGIGGIGTVTLLSIGLWRGLAMIDLAAGIVGLTAALLVVFGRWRVRIDRTGVNASPLTSWPRTHIPLNEIVSADTTTVNPLGDFGGWGYRVGTGGVVGIVVRGGPALRVHRTGGRTLVITVDDADIAAALLNTLADRARRR